jgi:CelD/BcsL family acetyltransferase involved in cellulose biosynthesis
MNPLRVYAVETIRRPEDLEALAPEWERLCRADPNATPFQTPTWGLAWWRHLGRGSLHCLAVHQEGELVGLAALYRSRRQCPPLRRLAILGTGRSDYLDFVAEPSQRDEVLLYLFDSLWRSRSEWDYLDLQQLPHNAHALQLPRISSERLAAYPHSLCPCLALAGEDGMENTPSRLRKNLRYSLRRLSDTGELRFRTSTQSSLDADLIALFRLHRSRWRARGLPGVFSSPKVQAFHREVAARFLDEDRLRLHVLERSGEVLSIALCYVMGGRAYYYGGGFDPDAAKYSPGSLVVAGVIRSAADEGCRELDFLRGEESYKRQWGCRPRRNHRVIGAALPGVGRMVHRLPAIEARLEREGMKVLEGYQRRKR